MVLAAPGLSGGHLPIRTSPTSGISEHHLWSDSGLLERLPSGAASPSHWAQVSQVCGCIQNSQRVAFISTFCLLGWVCLVFSKVFSKRANVKEFIVKETRVLLPEIRMILSSSNAEMWYHETPASVVEFPPHHLRPQPRIPITAPHFNSSFILPVQLFAALSCKAEQRKRLR